jgi:alkylation response protein AidB-like acyl-CoA dehydrogenase
LGIARVLRDRFTAGAAERDLKMRFPAEEMEEIRRSGLLGIAIAREYGGWGCTYADAARLVSVMAEADPSIAQMLVPHYWATGLLQLPVWEGDVRAHFSRAVCDGKLRWTNGYAELSNTRHVQDYSVTLDEAGDGWELNGRKFYCTGSYLSDYIYVTAVIRRSNQVCIALVPMNAPGITEGHDWDAMGQRTTASGSISFSHVTVPKVHIMKTDSLSEPDNLLSGLYPQALLTGVHVGIAKAALRDAIAYVKKSKRPWIHSPAERGREDFFTMRTIGQMAALVECIDASFERALQHFERVQASPSVAERAAVMIEIAKAKVVSSEFGLQVCNSVFDACGSASTLAKHDLDRHWRNLRTISLHDPVDYKFHLIGDFLLNDRKPVPTTYT